MPTPPDLDDLLKAAKQGQFKYKRNADGSEELETDGTEADGLAAAHFMRARSGVEAIGDMRTMHPHLFAETSKKKSLTLRDAIANYTAVEAPALKKGTWDARKYAFQTFVDALGAKTPVDEITRATASEWTTHLMRNNGLKRTVTNKVSHVAQLFEFLERQGHIVGNPVRGMVVTKQKEKEQRFNDGFTREPFDVEQLKVIFDPANLKRKRESHLRWGPVLGLYTGARVGEVAQIYLRDFIEENGVWCLKITNESDGQSLKNDRSRRLVPIHPDLVRLGLKKRIDALKKAGEVRLFPKVKLDGEAGVGAPISSGFSYYITAQLEFKPRRENGIIGFHGLRKTVIQTLQGSRLQEERRRAVVGHDVHDLPQTRGPDVHATIYMRPWRADELTEFCEGLKWGEWLDFEGLIPLLDHL